MSTKKQKERKKKKREEIAKKRVQTRRNILAKDKKERVRSARLERKFRRRIDPIVNDPNKKILIEEAKKEKNMNQIKKNIELLKALEAEYVKEQEHKKYVNQQLESEGHVSLKEKLEALNLKAKEKMTDQEKELGMIDRSINAEDLKEDNGE